MSDTGAKTGRCYCGAYELSVSAMPSQVAICHCVDCRRVTGAAAPAFAAFCPDQVRFRPDPGAGFQHTPGVTRWFCHKCGSPLAATFDYLPDQVYVPIGILDFADILTPDMQCHTAAMLPWIENMRSLPRHARSARAHLNHKRREQ